MKQDFEQISRVSGFMHHNDSEYVKLVVENVSSKIRDIFFYHYLNNSINFDFCIIKIRLCLKISSKLAFNKDL